jgi:HTH-type transcriptional regulator / antitoxin HigA
MTASSTAFAPDWASPPGDTLRDAMRDRGITPQDVAVATEISEDEIIAIISGRTEITLGVAQALARAVGATAQFWVNRECQYRDSLALGDLQHWVATLPTTEMQRLGWMPKPKSPSDLIRMCLDFFQVPDLDVWTERRGLLESARLRSSRSFPLDDSAVLAWLQQARRLSARIPGVGQWNPERLEAALPRIRLLTRMKDPERFIPGARHEFARAGVRFVVLMAPRTCRISGASLISDDGSAMIALTARHLSDDHFWFTLFHEAAHLLLHDTSLVFLDDLDEADPGSAQEKEADEFAARLLVPPALLDELPRTRIPRSREVIRAAVRHRVAPGIVVGHLQHVGVLGYENLNTLKRRYRWNGSTLESA